MSLELCRCIYWLAVRPNARAAEPTWSDKSDTPRLPKMSNVGYLQLHFMSYGGSELVCDDLIVSYPVWTRCYPRSVASGQDIASVVNDSYITLATRHRWPRQPILMLLVPLTWLSFKEILTPRLSTGGSSPDEISSMAISRILKRTCS